MRCAWASRPLGQPIAAFSRSPTSRATRSRLNPGLRLHPLLCLRAGAERSTFPASGRLLPRGRSDGADIECLRQADPLALVAMITALVAMAGDNVAPPRPGVVLWAWERPEDLGFAGPDVGVSVLAGSIVLSGEAIRVTGRRYPAFTLSEQRIVGVVHVEIDRRERLVWSPVQREAMIAKVLGLAKNPRLGGSNRFRGPRLRAPSAA
jgi:hypothetical protein